MVMDNYIIVKKFYAMEIGYKDQIVNICIK